MLSVIPAAAQTTLRMANWLPPSHLLVADVMRPWAAEVERVTAGRVKITILDAPIGPPPAHYDFAANGVADITFGVHNYTPGRFAISELAELPFLGDRAEHVSVAYWRVYQQKLAAANEHREVKVLSVFTHGPGHIFTKGRDVSSIDNLRGAKLRVGGGLASTITARIGAVPIQGPSSKAFELISGGVADGITFPFESVVFFRLQDLVDTGLIIPGGLYNTSFFVVMNRARWNALPAEDQAAIDRVSGEAMARLAGRAWDKWDDLGAAQMRGKKLITADQRLLDALKTPLQTITDETLAKITAKGVDAPAALRALRDEVAKVAAGQ
jgi:TRAP-type C4-dicarboxylate transport system substrate-binding protein